jgi:hypothetical protein
VKLYRAMRRTDAPFHDPTVQREDSGGHDVVATMPDYGFRLFGWGGGSPITECLEGGGGPAVGGGLVG